MSADQLARSVAVQRRNIDAALASYTALPFFPGERDLDAPIPGLLRRLDTQLATASPASTDAAIDVFDQTIDDIDRTLERIETFDASQGQRLGLAIARSRSDSRSLIFLLDAATVLLAIVAVTLAVRVRRRAIRALIDETNVAEENLADLRTQVDESRASRAASRTTSAIRCRLRCSHSRSSDRAAASRRVDRAR